MIKDSSWRPLPDFLTIKPSKIEGLGPQVRVLGPGGPNNPTNKKIHAND